MFFEMIKSYRQWRKFRDTINKLNSSPQCNLHNPQICHNDTSAIAKDPL